MKKDSQVNVSLAGAKGCGCRHKMNGEKDREEPSEKNYLTI